MIITGAPVEKLSYEQVDYWEELESIMDYTKKNVFSTLHICWGAQAGLYHHYGIDKYMLEEKLFGVFPHNIPIMIQISFQNAVFGFDQRSEIQILPQRAV